MNLLVRAILCATAVAAAGAFGHRQMASAVRPSSSMAQAPLARAELAPMARLAERSGWRIAAVFPGRVNHQRILLSVYETNGTTEHAADCLRSYWRERSVAAREFDLGAFYMTWDETALPCLYAMAIQESGRSHAIVLCLRSEEPLRILFDGSPGMDLPDVPGYVGQRGWLVLESADGRLAVGVYRAAASPAAVMAHLEDRLHAEGWRDLLPTWEPKWSLLRFPLMFESPRGGFGLWSFLPLAEGVGTAYAVYRWRPLEETP